MNKIIAKLLLIFVFMLFANESYAATWYLQANSSANDWNTLSIWYSQPFAGGTNPTSISSADNFDLNGYSIVTPKLSTGTTTFGGNQLILHGGLGGFISTKTNPAASIAIPNLTSYGGFIQDNAFTGILPISVTNFVNNSNTTLSGCQSGRGLNFTIGTLSGSGDLCAIGAGGGAAGGAVLFNVTTASAFTGTLYIVDGCQFTFNNGMTSGGALDIEGAGTTVTINAAVTFKGLTIDGVIKAPGTYTASSLGFAGSGSIVVQSPAAQTLTVTSAFGVNLPGGSFSSGSFYPTTSAEWAYYHGKALNLVRMGFLWERVQPTLNGTLSTTELSKMDSAIALAAAQGMSVILDMHNYDRYNSNVIGSASVSYANYQNAWQQLAAHYQNMAGVYGYDIMNEPHDDSGTWDSTAAQYGVNGVRQSDTTHYIIVEGDSYAGAQSWMSVNANLNVTDSANKIIYSAHTYWDSNDSGTYSGYANSTTCYDSNNCYPNIGVDRVAQFVYWLSLKGAKGLVGEFGVPNNVASPDSRWNGALDNFLTYLNKSGVNATYWAGGEAWGTTYPLSCAIGTPPANAPAMNVLEQFGAEPWVQQDIGIVTPPGSATYTGGTYTVNTGNGLELMTAYTSDEFTYLFQPVTGNCTATARVASLSANDTIKAEGGLMIRNDLTASSAFALSGVTTGRGTQFTYRLSAGVANASVAGPSGVAPYWVRIVRSGNTFTAYVSSTGTSWTQAGTAQTITMGSTAYIGFPLANHGGTGTATFDNFSLTSP